MSRIEKLCRALENIADCALITGDINRRYYTGMKSSAGTVLAFADKAYLIIDFRYIEKARAVVKDCEVIEQDNLYEQINSLIVKHGAKTCAVEAETVTVAQLGELESKLRVKVVSNGALSKAIAKQRAVKTESDTAKICEAQRIAEAGFEHMLEYIAVGRTEREISLELDYFMLKNGAEDLSFETIAVSGANTSMPHGVPTDKTVENGDFVLLDFGAVVDGWHSDMTRTVAVGNAGDEMKRVYDIVLNAQETALAGLRAGITGKQYDALARDVIVESGYGDAFGHSLGHGVGMEIHEIPYGGPKSEQIIPEGAVITCEPGIYLPGAFGVRIEDMAYVTKKGCRNLTHAPKQLIILSK